MKYTITWCEKKHIDSLNKDVLDCNANDEQGNTVKFSIWSDFPNFAGIMNGGVVEGNIWNKPNTDKYTLYLPKDPATATTGRMGGASKLMDKKADNIATAQESKDLSIKISSTMNKAIDLAIAEKDISPENILKWRKWIWIQWLAKDTDFAPFPTTGTADAEQEYKQV